MELDRYTPLTDDSHETYEFLSSGPKGTIKKVVVFQHMGRKTYNLAFGDWDEKEQEISDKARSNNADQEKVLATVAAAVVDFMEYHPDAIVLAEGSTDARTRLYRIGITRYWREISKQFDVQGFISGHWESFQPGKNYQKFALATR